MDMKQYPAFIISHVLEYRRWEDWKIIVNYYGVQRIVDVCKHLRTLDPVCLSYICTISHTNPKDYRCWHIRQSSPHTLEFLKELMLQPILVYIIMA